MGPRSALPQTPLLDRVLAHLAFRQLEDLTRDSKAKEEAAGLGQGLRWKAQAEAPTATENPAGRLREGRMRRQLRAQAPMPARRWPRCGSCRGT